MFDLLRRGRRARPLDAPRAGETGADAVLLGGASVPTELFARHAVVSGMPGTGKTTLVASLVAQLVAKGVGVAVVEPVKAEYAGLLCGRGVPVAAYGGPSAPSPLATNPLHVDSGVAPGAWSQQLAAAVCDAYGVVEEPLPQHVRALIERLYRRGGVDLWEPASSRPWPNPAHLLHEVERYVAQECSSSEEVRANVRGALAFRARRLCAHPSFSPRGAGAGMLADDLLSRPGATVLQTSELGQEAGRMFSMVALMRVLSVAPTLGARPLHTVVVVEEAHALFRDLRTGEPTMFSRVFEQALRTLRSAGVGFVTVDQDPDTVPEGVWANSSVKVCFACGAGRGVQAVASALGLTAEQARRFSMLPPRRALLGVPGGGAVLVDTSGKQAP